MNDIPVNHRFWFWKRFLTVLVLKTFAESLENVFDFYRRFGDVLITFLKLENGCTVRKMSELYPDVFVRF